VIPSIIIDRIDDPISTDGDGTMKRLFLTLACAALANTAWAQAPMQTLPTAPPPGAVVLSVQKSVVVTQQAPIQQVSGGRLVGGACCTEACCTPTKTICVPEPGIKVTVKINYSSECTKICFPKCTLFGAGCCNSGCEQGQCSSHIYQKKYLVKKVCITECPTTNCVPVEVPACETGHCRILGRPAACAPDCAPAPVVVPATPAPTKK
jgi:hypothetical protein